MKNPLLYTIILLLLIAACKYEDGPALSLRSKYQRLKGPWKIDNVTVDGIDSTQKYIDSCNCEMEVKRYDYEPHDMICFMSKCKKNGLSGYTLSAGLTFIDHKERIQMSFAGDVAGPWYQGFGPIREYYLTEWEILKLTHNKFWFTTQYNGKEYIFKFRALTE